MKVIEGMKPSEVLKAVEDGETKLAWFNSVTEKWVEWKGVTPTVEDVAQAIGCKYKVGVIDDSKPVIDWDGFDWEFFNQWDGVHVAEPEEVRFHQRHWTFNTAPPPSCDSTLVASPFYPWFGGKQPVPDGVEVEIVDVFEDDADNVDRERQALAARDVRWNSDRLIAFRLTGRVL